MAGEEALDGMALLLLKDEKDRYAKAKALHSRLETTSPTKLQIVCFDSYIRMAENVVSEWKRPGENAFGHLPNILRIDMLNYLLSEAHEKDRNKEQLGKHLYELTYMLMNETTVKLDYGVYKQGTSYSRNTAASLITTLEEFQKILAHAAVQCPNLEHLAVYGHRPRDSLRPSFTEAKNSMTPGSGIDHLLQLEQLRHLDIYGIWFWTDEGLNKLFSKLKKLVTLKLLIHSSATVSGFQNIPLLKELEEFHFVIADPDEDSDSDDPDDDGFILNYECIYSYCAENVPSLKLIGAATSDCADSSNQNYLTHLRLVTPNIKGTSMLEHLHSKSILPEAEFPNLQHLHFYGPLSSHCEIFFQKFITFAHLTSLHLGCLLDSKLVALMLMVIGQQLNTLSIFLGGTEDLFHILHSCPNLVRFQEIEFFRYIQGDLTSKYEALVTEHNVRLLERCEANFYGLVHGGKDRLFELLVFAPFMKDLSLSCISMTKTQCLLFHDAEEGKFSNLERLQINDLDLDPSCSMDDFGLMIQCIVCSAPRLNFIELDWSNQDLTDKWNREQNVAQSFMDLVR